MWRITLLPIVCVAHSFTVDAAAKYFDWKSDEVAGHYEDSATKARVSTLCRLSGRTHYFSPSALQMTDLILAGAAEDMSTVEVKLGAFETRTHASVCGIRFTAGESLTGTPPPYRPLIPSPYPLHHTTFTIITPTHYQQVNLLRLHGVIHDVGLCSLLSSMDSPDMVYLTLFFNGQLTWDSRTHMRASAGLAGHNIYTSAFWLFE